MIKYKLVNEDDGNIEILLESDKEYQALMEGIEQLGYRFVAYEDNES